MNKINTSIFLFFLSFQLLAQSQDSLYQEVSPKGGINQLAVKYYGIEFSKQQRAALKDVEIEFVFLIDEQGQATLSEVNGIDDPGIIDSLQNKTAKIEAFNPRIKEGVPVSSIYFMRLTFPTYKRNNRRLYYNMASVYNEAALNDFEYIRKSRSRLDVGVGGLINQFVGSPGNHLEFGGGLRIEITYSDNKGFIYGFNMTAYFNKLKKDYSIDTNNREQVSSPATGLVGVTFGKWFDKFNIQSEIAFASQNITEKLDDNDRDWVQLKGWSPGLTLNYPIQLGKMNPMYYYGSPSLFMNNLNLHFGLRYLFYPHREASGLVTEFGIAYRMTLNKVKEYKLKDEFLNQ